MAECTHARGRGIASAAVGFAAALGPAAMVGPAAVNIMLVGTLVLTLVHVGTRHQKLVVPPFASAGLAFAALIGISVVSALLSPDPRTGLRFVAKHWYVAVLVVAFWAGHAAFGKAAVRMLVVVLVLNLIVIALRPLELHSGQVWLDKRLTDAYWWRAEGLVNHAMTLGGVSMLALFCTEVLPLRKRQRMWLRLLTVLILLFSGTRSAWLGALAGWLALSLLRSWPSIPWRPIVLLLLVSAFAVALPQVRHRIQDLRDEQVPTRSIGRRILLWKTAGGLVAERPLLGVGPGRFREEAQRRLPPRSGSTVHAHNTFLNIAAETGLIGLTVWLWWIATLSRELLRRKRVAAPAFAGIIAFLVAGCFEANYLDAEVMAMLYWMTGVGLGLQRDPA